MPPSDIKYHRRLPDLYSDLFTLANHLKGAREPGDPQVLRRHLIIQLNEVDKEAEHLGVVEETRKAARYAVVAFIDEMILSSPAPYREWWAANKLQQELFNEDSAGVGFFDRLETVRRSIPVPLDLLEVYYFCLVLGFEGQYRIHRHEQLQALVEGISLQIKTDATGPLSPHGKRPDEAMVKASRGLPLWGVIVATAALLVSFYLGLSFTISRHADRTLLEIRERVRAEAIPHPSSMGPES